MVAKQASYGTVHKVYRERSAGRSAPPRPVADEPAQPALTLVTASDEADAVEEAAAPAPANAPAEATSGEPTLEAAAPPAGTVVQHLGSWLLLGGLRELGFYDLAAQHGGEVTDASLRAAIDATAISLALGEQRMERPREAKKVLATLFAAPGTIHLGTRSVTVRLMPAASASERLALRAFLADLTRRQLSLPGDPDGRRLAWRLK